MKPTNTLITNNLDLKRNKNSLLKYSSAFKSCSTEASLYAKCVVNSGENLKQDNCLKEFNQLKTCIQNAFHKI
jgi:hypothetical protein